MVTFFLQCLMISGNVIFFFKTNPSMLRMTKKTLFNTELPIPSWLDWSELGNELLISEV